MNVTPPRVSLHRAKRILKPNWNFSLNQLNTLEMRGVQSPTLHIFFFEAATSWAEQPVPLPACCWERPLLLCVETEVSLPCWVSTKDTQSAGSMSYADWRAPAMTQAGTHYIKKMLQSKGTDNHETVKVQKTEKAAHVKTIRKSRDTGS